MSVMLTVARKELLELQANKRVLISIAIFAMLFAWLNSSAFSELQWIFLSTMIGMYASFSLSGQAFNQEKMSGTLETQFCGPVDIRDLWSGKILGTLIPAVVISYFAAIVSVVLVLGEGPVAIGLPAVVYLVAVLPALVASFIGLMGFVQLNFEARTTRMVSVGVMVLIFSMLAVLISLPQNSAEVSWQSLALIAVAAAGLLTVPALLVNRLSKERIILTSEG
jgi:ABC-type Na+ efflux pump permease subunit